MTPRCSEEVQHHSHVHRIRENNRVPTLCVVTRVPKRKNGFEPRTCVACGRPFEWRKKWAKDWENVLYCSDKCRSNGKKN